MNASRRVYSVVVALAVPLASLVVFWRGWRERTYWQGWPERFGLGEPMPGLDVRQIAEKELLATRGW